MIFFIKPKHRKLQSPSAGAKAENWARFWLQKQSLQFVEKNYRTTRGEIDLIMQDGDTLVFVEVRLRQNAQFATAAQSIDRRKQQRIISAARHYLQARGLWEKIPCRFDAICLQRDTDNGDGYRVEWLKNAFS